MNVSMNMQKVVYTLTRDLVASQLDTIRQEVLALIGPGEVHLVIDLQQVQMMDSKGLALLMLCHRTLNERRGALTVVTANADFRKLFQLMRLDELFEVADTLPT